MLVEGGGGEATSYENPREEEKKKGEGGIPRPLQVVVLGPPTSYLLFLPFSISQTSSLLSLSLSLLQHGDLLMSPSSPPSRFPCPAPAQPVVAHAQRNLTSSFAQWVRKLISSTLPPRSLSRPRTSLTLIVFGGSPV